MARSEFSKAIPLLEDALRIGPMWQIHANLGICQWHTGRIKEATAHLETAYQLNPTEENKARMSLAKRSSGKRK